MEKIEPLKLRRFAGVCLVLLQALLLGWAMLAGGVCARALGDILRRVDLWNGKPLPGITRVFVRPVVFGETAWATVFAMATILLVGGAFVWRAPTASALNFRLVVVISLNVSLVLAWLCFALLCAALPFVTFISRME